MSEAPATLEHPLEVGAHASCQRSGTDFAVEIIERREESDGSWSYYVHFEGTDRRLDDWVSAGQLAQPPAPPPPPVGRVPRGAVRGAPGADGLGSRRATRNMKRKIDVSNNVQSVADEELEKEHEESTKVKNIKVIEMGRFEIDAWYFSPYPDAFAQQERLFVCPFSLKYFKKRTAYLKHLNGVTRRGPPGMRVYRAPAPPLSQACLSLQLPQPSKLTLYEVDGSLAKVYCQCVPPLRTGSSPSFCLLRTGSTPAFPSLHGPNAPPLASALHGLNPRTRPPACYSTDGHRSRLSCFRRPLPPGEALSRPQDVILRRRPVSILRALRGGREGGGDPRRIL